MFGVEKLTSLIVCNQSEHPLRATGNSITTLIHGSGMKPEEVYKVITLSFVSASLGTTLFL